MTDAYEKSAARLLDATAEDRDWVLSQIDPTERIRIVAKLRDMVESTGELQNSSGPSRTDMARNLESPIEKSYPQLTVADSADLERVLNNEPDWVIALLVQDARWPWIEQLLSSLEPARLERIENWVRAGRRSIKPTVTEQLFRLTNNKLLETDTHASEPTAFEDILVRLRSKTSSNVSVTAQQAP